MELTAVSSGQPVCKAAQFFPLPPTHTLLVFCSEVASELEAWGLSPPLCLSPELAAAALRGGNLAGYFSVRRFGASEARGLAVVLFGT